MPSWVPEMYRSSCVRARWTTWADAWARDFNALCRAHGFLPQPALQQRTLFEDVVKVMSREPGATALFVVDDDGLAANGIDLGSQERDPSPVTLESQCSAILGLLEGYLATSDTSYRDRAKIAYRALADRFYMSDVRAFRTELGESATMTWTPRAIGAFTGASTI